MSRVRELSDFFEHLPVPLYRSAPDGELLAGNRALAQILGYDSIEALRDVVDSVASFYISPESRAAWLEEITANGTVRDFDVELRRKDGQVVWVRDTARAVFDDAGELRFAEGCLIDVTDRIRLERSRDQFVATVSHELRSPITAIFGLSAELAERYEGFDDDERREMIALVSREAEEASWLIEDLLVAHRSDLNGVFINNESFPILGEVERVLAGLGEELRIDGDPDMSVRADPLRTRQVLRNLVSNAMRYGGDEVFLTVQSGDGEVSVSVCDSGDPIADEELESIFEPFVTAASHAQSMGLGLWISKRLSELMGGSVRYSHDGSSSIFTLTLPAG